MKKLRAMITMYAMPFFVLVSTFMFAMFQGGFVSWFLFYSFIPFALVPILLKVSALSRVNVSRQIKKKEYVYGESIEIELTITYKGFMPLFYVVIEDLMSESLLVQLDSQNKCIRFPFWRKEMIFTYRIPAASRGEHDFKGVKLTTGDLLGFYTKVREVECFQRLLVYPHYEKAAHKTFEALYEQGQPILPIRNLDEVAMISGIRQYMPGDRLSWIHWKATAKRNEIMTKEFEESKNQDVVLVLDQSPSQVFEELVSFAASLTYAFLQKGVGIACVGTALQNAPITIGRGEQQRKRIFYELAKVQIDGVHSLDYFLQRVKLEIPSQATFMIITSSLSIEALNALAVMKGNSSIAIVVMQKKEQEATSFSESVKLTANKIGIPCTYVSPSSWRSSSKEEGS